MQTHGTFLPCRARVTWSPSAGGAARQASRGFSTPSALVARGKSHLWIQRHLQMMNLPGVGGGEGCKTTSFASGET